MRAAFKVHIRFSVVTMRDGWNLIDEKKKGPKKGTSLASGATKCALMEARYTNSSTYHSSIILHYRHGFPSFLRASFQNWWATKRCSSQGANSFTITLFWKRTSLPMHVRLLIIFAAGCSSDHIQTPVYTASMFAEYPQVQNERGSNVHRSINGNRRWWCFLLTFVMCVEWR